MSKQQQKLLVDIGSSSVKFYLLDKKELKPLGVKSLPLKDGFTPEQGLRSDNKKNLLDSIAEVQRKYSQVSTHIYATALFRKMLPAAQVAIKDECMHRFGASFTLISAEEENEYLEKGMVGKYNAPDPILLINIGGGSTELVVVENGRVKERDNIQLGVGSILSQYPDINISLTDKGYEGIKNTIIEELPKLTEIMNNCICTGGELTYMERAKYPLEKNKLFSDKDHPLMIPVQSWAEHNKYIISLPMHDLEEIMPENATWMHGTRAFLAFLEAICQKYNIMTIVPSDANLINGIVRVHFS